MRAGGGSREMVGTGRPDGVDDGVGGSSGATESGRERGATWGEWGRLAVTKGSPNIGRNMLKTFQT